MHIVFIRHTSTAAEVDEETFFRARDRLHRHSDGARRDAEDRARTLFAGGLEYLCREASDGDNFLYDMPGCLQLPDHEILPVCQYFADIETAQASASTTRRRRRSGTLFGDRPPSRNFAMRRVASPEDIYPVFHELFSASGVAA